MAELQPYNPGFWARDYDPTQARWKDTESELGGFDVDLRAPPDVQAVTPDITRADLRLPPGPPGEAAWRQSQAVPSILQQSPQYDRDTMPPTVSALSADAVVPSLRETEGPLSNWNVDAQHQLQQDIRREETDPTSRIQSTDQRADPDTMPYSLWKDLDSPEINKAKEKAEELAAANRNNQSFKIVEDGEYVTNLNYDPLWRNPEFGGIWRLMDLVKEADFLPQGAVLPERLPGVPRAADIQRIERGWEENDKWGQEGGVPREWNVTEQGLPPYRTQSGLSSTRGEWKYPGFRYPSAVGQIVYDPSGGLDPTRSTQTMESSTKEALPGSELWSGGYSDKFMTSALAGVFTGDQKHVLINEFEAAKYPGEYEFHEDMHVIYNALARTPDLWKDIEIKFKDGPKQKLIDIIYPKIGGNRVWDREMAHISIYAGSKVPPIVARIEYAHGHGTQLYPQIFKGLSAKEKIIRAQAILKGLNAASAMVADKFDQVVGGEIKEVSPQGYTTTTPWLGGIMSQNPPRGSVRQATTDTVDFYLEN